MTKSVELAERIRKFRVEELNASQAAFAEMLGVAQPSVSAWESGDPDSPGPAISSFIKLAEMAVRIGSWQDANFFFSGAGIDQHTRTTLLLMEQEERHSKVLLSERNRMRELTFKKLTAGEHAGKIGAFEGEELIGVGDPGDLEPASGATKELENAVQAYMSEHKVDRSVATYAVMLKRKPGEPK
jgi:transcriptional regulator with XRE-family HTH domain